MDGLADGFSHSMSHMRDTTESNSGTNSGAHSDDDIMDAVGQLSLNEDEQVRYHGKASGLHLLGGKERVDQRNEGGIWLVVGCLLF